MRYLTACYTDQGKRKSVNQDSLLISQGRFDGQEVVLAVVCDGMGGHTSGELASAEVIHAFTAWFREKFRLLPERGDFEDELYGSWELLLRDVHGKIRRHGQLRDTKMGTTVTAMLLWQEHYYIVHMGDSRIYEIKEEAVQLTKDQTLAELMKTNDSTKTTASKSENVLLQALGASKAIRPAYYSGSVKSNAVYLMCTDGFRHKVSNQELLQVFAPDHLTDEGVMEERGKNAVQAVMDRGERDNISVLLIRTIQEQDSSERPVMCVHEKNYILDREIILVHTEETI